MNFASGQLGGDKCRGNMQRNIRNMNVFPGYIMDLGILSLAGQNRHNQEGGMLVYDHGAKSAHVPQMMETSRFLWGRQQKRGKQGLALKMLNS